MPSSMRDCWYVRASPARAQCRADVCVTSAPNSSTVPVEGGMSPAMTLKSVVFPAPFGPEDRSPLAVGDVEIDVADGDETPEAPADPPQAEGRLGVFEGLCYFAQRPT